MLHQMWKAPEIRILNLVGGTWLLVLPRGCVVLFRLVFKFIAIGLFCFESSYFLLKALGEIKLAIFHLKEVIHKICSTSRVTAVQVETGSSCVAQMAWNLQFFFSRWEVTPLTAQRAHGSFCLHSHSMPLIPSCTVCVLGRGLSPYTGDTVFIDTPAPLPCCSLDMLDQQTWNC